MYYDSDVNNYDYGVTTGNVNIVAMIKFWIFKS